MIRRWTSRHAPTPTPTSTPVRKAIRVGEHESPQRCDGRNAGDSHPGVSARGTHPCADGTMIGVRLPRSAGASPEPIPGARSARFQRGTVTFPPFPCCLSQSLSIALRAHAAGSTSKAGQLQRQAQARFPAAPAGACQGRDDRRSDLPAQAAAAIDTTRTVGAAALMVDYWMVAGPGRKLGRPGVRWISSGSVGVRRFRTVFCQARPSMSSSLISSCTRSLASPHLARSSE